MGRFQPLLAVGVAACSLVLPFGTRAGGFERPLELRPAGGSSSAITIRNLGPAGLLSPRVLKAGQPDFVSLDAVVADVTRQGMSEREKAEALWVFLRDRSSEACPATAYAGRVVYNPLAILNEMGYGCCDQLAPALAALWKAAGLRVRLVVMAFHTVPEVFYEDAWHMYDPAHGVLYLLEDGKTVANVWALAVRPARVASVPDPSGFDAEWMASKYESQGPAARYVDMGATATQIEYWLPARSSLTFSSTPAKLKRSDLRPLAGGLAPDFSEVVFRGTARFGDPSWPLFLRGTEVRGGQLNVLPGAKAGEAVLEITGPGAALTGSLTVPYSVEAGARLRIRVSGDPDLPGSSLAEIVGPKKGVFHDSLQKPLGSIRERRFFVVFNLDCGLDSHAVRVGPELQVETVMQWSRSALGSLKGPASVLRYRDTGGDVSRNVEVLVGKRRLPLTTAGGLNLWDWEASADDGLGPWRSYLSRPGAEIRKVLKVPAGDPPAECRLLTLVNGTARDGDKPVFTAVFQVEGKEIAQVPVPDLEGIRWLRSTFDPSLLAEKREIDVRVSLKAESELATGHLDLFGSTLNLGRSSFNGQKADLSEDPETQVGEFMIRVRCSGRKR